MVKLGQSYTCRHAFTSTAQVAMRSGVMAAGDESELREGMQGKEAVAATIKRQKHAGVHMHASIVTDGLSSRLSCSSKKGLLQSILIPFSLNANSNSLSFNDLRHLHMKWK